MAQKISYNQRSITLFWVALIFCFAATSAVPKYMAAVDMYLWCSVKCSYRLCSSRVCNLLVASQ